MKGMIFNIQKFSLNDGPGIRTTVFFKGCPLKCWWCHNPESQSSEPELMYHEKQCIQCHSCEEKNMLEKSEACPTNAWTLMGKQYDVETLVEILLQDKVFYDQSNGGITFSGGEPLMQIDYLLEVMKQLKKQDIHVALDTTGYADWSVLEQTADYVDLYLYDIKHLDQEKHIALTGVDNEMIIHNLKQLHSLDKNIVIRVPVIPEYNDDEGYINGLGAWLQANRLYNVSLLPYHRIAMDKYNRLNLEYNRPDIQSPKEAHMEAIQIVLSSYGLNVSVGG